MNHDHMDKKSIFYGQKDQQRFVVGKQTKPKITFKIGRN